MQIVKGTWYHHISAALRYLSLINIMLHFCRRLVDTAHISYFLVMKESFLQISHDLNTLSSSLSSSSSSLRHRRWSNLGGCPTTSSSHPLPLLVAPHYPNFIVASTIRKHHKALLDWGVNKGPWIWLVGIMELHYWKYLFIVTWHIFHWYLVKIKICRWVTTNEDPLFWTNDNFWMPSLH